MPYGMNFFVWSGDVTGDEWVPLFGRLKKMGFDSVEVPIFDPRPELYQRLAKRLDDAGLARNSCTALMAEQNLISPDAAVRRKGADHLKAVLDCAQALGAVHLGGPLYSALGVFTGSGPTADEWRWAVEGVRGAAEHAAKVGVMLGVEYLNRFEVYLVNCAADVVRLINEVNHPSCRMMYDTFHANIEEKSITQALETAAPVLAHVQVSENDRSTPGKGGVNWDETFAALRKIGYTGTLTIEAFGQRVPQLAAATKIWRRMFETEEKLAEEGLAFIRSRWEKTG